ncbi:hypothetical protein EVAR_61387_1 [Eumeta japonica]|uniref:Uncharacterized protein n=1 Tax=Eumeta variegata TaxID=151549 RepID=A0A4C1ZA27_EUMVA|nr:hypothetical protein EVAR_61387_1 [Eumeta japonica]
MNKPKRECRQCDVWRADSCHLSTPLSGAPKQRTELPSAALKISHGRHSGSFHGDLLPNRSEAIAEERKRERSGSECVEPAYFGGARDFPAPCNK